jgi:hypothetical protein
MRPATAATAYSCHMPRALLCENCARDLSITLLPNGACRIAFAPASRPADGAPSPPQSAEVDLQIDVAPPVAASSAPLARHAQWSGNRRLRRVSRLVTAAPESRCFVFNGSRYCE